MKWSPILFKTPMVQAILADRKTQTRRVIADRLLWKVMPPEHESFQSDLRLLCPYGGPGDRLWVKETRWRNGGYVADGPSPLKNDGKVPSLFMKRWASRIFLELTAVRAERLQEISEADAEAEGVQVQPIMRADEPLTTHREQFRLLWESINKGELESWEANPWVWVLGFRRLSREEANR